jgi:hypothetical protein
MRSSATLPCSDVLGEIGQQKSQFSFTFYTIMSGELVLIGVATVRRSRQLANHDVHGDCRWGVSEARDATGRPHSFRGSLRLMDLCSVNVIL